MTISYRNSESTNKGKFLWQTTCLTLIWNLWWERNATIFSEDKWMTVDAL